MKLEDNKAGKPKVIGEVEKLPRLALIEHVKENQDAFEASVRWIGSQLGFSPDWLMQVMYLETAGTFSPSIRNAAGSSAIGLIQFMASTAKSLGTSTEALAKMTNVQQLNYVYKYFLPYKNKLKSFADVYMAVFYPVMIGRPDNYIIFRKGSVGYRQNAGIDLNKNGVITKGEFIEWVKKKLPKK